jgi:hypothetical protein
MLQTQLQRSALLLQLVKSAFAATAQLLKTVQWCVQLLIE